MLFSSMFTGKRLVLLAVLLITFLSIMTACIGEKQISKEEADMTLTLTSTAFKEGSEIPIVYTCDGQDISPPLTWSEAPANTKTFVLIVDDPDAPGGVFTHWVLFNLPSNIKQVEENIPSQQRLSNGALQGKNGFGNIGYGGPCPPRGPAHHYRFAVYAIDRTLDIAAGASKQKVIDAMKGHVVAQGQLTGTYQRQH